MKYLALSLVFSVLVLNLQAQDKIIRTNGEIINGKTLKLTNDVIEYTLTGSDIIYTVKTKNVSVIIYEGGEELNIVEWLDKNQVYYNKYHHSLEYTPTDLVDGKIRIGYRYAFANKFSIRVAGAYKLVNRNDYVNIFFNDNLEFQFNYHPMKFRKLDYSIGIAGRGGAVRAYNYDNYYWNGTTYSTSSEVVVQRFSVEVSQELTYNLNNRFYLNGGFRIGQYFNIGNTNNEQDVSAYSHLSLGFRLW